MPLVHSKRNFAAAVLAAVLLCVCTATSSISQTTVSTARSQPTDEQVMHALNRLTFGPRPGDIERVKRMGITAWIEEQLHPESLQESPEVQRFASTMGTYGMSDLQIIATEADLAKARRQAQVQAGQDADTPEKEREKQYHKRCNQEYPTLQLIRDVESPRQLQEVMTEFWFNHFNVFIGKEHCRGLINNYRDEAIRPFALGKFGDLVWATCHHPAMLYYLDNAENSANGTIKNRKGDTIGLNENYARELMELHTLGVNGGYTQKDVTELARILTGLRAVDPRNTRGMQPVGRYGAYFDERRHDFGIKQFLGKTVQGTGYPEIELALNMLVSNPNTAHHVCYQIAQYFVSDDPPTALVDRMAATFGQSQGDIKSVMNTMLTSEEFWDSKNVNAKYKTPLRFVVSALRACDAHPSDYKPIVRFLAGQGQPVYGKLTPDGYKNTEEAWLNPDALLNRISFVTAVTAGRQKAILDQAVDSRALAKTVTDDHFTSQTVAVLEKAPPQLRSALILGSPEFLYY